MMRSTALVAALISLILMTSPAAHAASSAAIILEVSGVEDAQITAPSQIKVSGMTGTTIALGKRGSITFVHYSSCNRVTAVGGSVTVFADHYTSSDSQLTEVKLTCPELVPVRQSRPAPAGPFMQEMVPSSLISLHPTIVMISKSGPISMDVAFQRLTRELNPTPTGTPIVTKVINGFVQMPDAGLGPGQYRLTWTSPNRSPMQITVSAEHTPGEQSLLIVDFRD